MSSFVLCHWSFVIGHLWCQAPGRRHETKDKGPMTNDKPSLPRLKHPGIGGQKIDGFLDPSSDRQLRLPPKRADLFRVEEDERAVSDPAAVAAGVGALRGDAHPLADPA